MMADEKPLYHQPVHIAVIGGTGLQSLPHLAHATTISITTPWGAPSYPISILEHRTTPSSPPTPIAFLSRHDPHHSLAPHEIPNRANIAALRRLGVRCVIAFSAVGSLQEHIRPRDFVVPDQLIDRTKGIRPFTFFEGGVVGHVGFADPFDVALAQLVAGVGGSDRFKGEDVKVHQKGTLICMEGPQFSTRAESNLYRAWGGDVINMSAVPEAKLAREAEMAYAMVCMATDYDCWREAPSSASADPQEGDVTVATVMANMRANSKNAATFLSAVLDELSREEWGKVVRAEHLKGQAKMAAGVTAVEGRNPETVEKLRWLFPGEF